MKNILKKIGVIGIIIAMLAPFVEMPVAKAATETCTDHTVMQYYFADVTNGDYWKQYTSTNGYTTYTIYPYLFPEESGKTIKILNTKIAYSFKTAIILGILCNFLVCIAVFLATNAKTITEKIIVIYLPIFTFIVLSFEHSIANMFYLSVGYILDNSVKLSTILINNLLPVTIGNIIGGTLLGLSIWYLKESD